MVASRAHFIKIFQARKPEYLWLVFWRDHQALEKARTNPLWRDQIKRFEAGNFYKSIPVELVCEALDSFIVEPAKPNPVAKPAKAPKAAPAGKSKPKIAAPSKAAASEDMAPTEGE